MRSDDEVEAYGGVKLQFHLFLISTLDGRDWSVSLPGRLSIGKCRLCALNTRLGGPSASLDTLEREKSILPLAGIEPLLPCCPEDMHFTFLFLLANIFTQSSG
jgi:hypothetical protein